jgi:hypothetical protein
MILLHEFEWNNELNIMFYLPTIIFQDYIDEQCWYWPVKFGNYYEFVLD